MNPQNTSIQSSGGLSTGMPSSTLSVLREICTESILFKDGRDLFLQELLKRWDQQAIEGMDQIESISLLYEISGSLICEHPDYDHLAGRLVMIRRMLDLLKRFGRDQEYSSLDSIISDLQETRNDRILSMDIISVPVRRWFNKYELNYMKDFSYDYLGALTLDRAYLLENETVQDMLLRVSIGIHHTSSDDTEEDRENTLNTYELMSEKRFIHASPTLFYSGTTCNQLSSCYLLNIKGDSLDKIYETLSDSAMISKYAGGIGISISCIRSRGSTIGSTGRSNGIVPMLKVFNETAKYVDQGGGKRKGAIAIYLEPWHADITDFLGLGSKHASEDSRASDLFYGLWVPDLFMQRVLDDQDWSLFCPNTVHLSTGEHLWDKHGQEFNQLYLRCEEMGIQTRTVKARDIWDDILRSQIETGSPYILYKDTCNARSNHQHLGTIKSSNLCSEIIQYTDDEEIAVCTLSSVSLPSVIKPRTSSDDSRASSDMIDWPLLRRIVRQITVNLDRIVSINEYPLPESKRSADRHRAIGIGIQGLSDAFCMLGLPYDSDEAILLNRLFSEHIYYYALEMSVELARKYGAYESFQGSQFSRGILQFDHQDQNVFDRNGEVFDRNDTGQTLDWNGLKKDIMMHGTRNSLLTAYMPTASTSQILGNNEGFEAYSSNLYNRKTLSGDFTVINKHLVRDLYRIGLWNRRVYENIMLNNGSVQQIDCIPDHIKKIYRTTWELPIGPQLLMARDRGLFIDQSQSMSLYFPDSSSDQEDVHEKNDRLTSSLIHGWKLGLKTGIYYVRTRPSVHPIKFTVSEESQKMAARIEYGRRTDVCRTREECLSCQG